MKVRAKQPLHFKGKKTVQVGEEVELDDANAKVLIAKKIVEEIKDDKK
jgi:hypothetical protein